MTASFDEDYGHYKQLLGKMDQQQSLNGKFELFRELSGLLNQMERDISTGKCASSSWGSVPRRREAEW